MLPNAFASYYIKRGWNVWITDFYIKFGSKPGHTQWPDLMSVFFFKERKFMKIIALDICWNSQNGQLSTEQEHSCTNMRWAIKNEKCWALTQGSRIGFLVCLIIQLITELQTYQLFILWKCICTFVKRDYFEIPPAGVILLYSRRKYKCQNEAIC